MSKRKTVFVRGVTSVVAALVEDLAGIRELHTPGGPSPGLQLSFMLSVRCQARCYLFKFYSETQIISLCAEQDSTIVYSKLEHEKNISERAQPSKNKIWLVGGGSSLRTKMVPSMSQSSHLSVLGRCYRGAGGVCDPALLQPVTLFYSTDSDEVMLNGQKLHHMPKGESRKR